MKAGWGLDNNRKGYAASAAGAVAGGAAAGAHRPRVGRVVSWASWHSSSRRGCWRHRRAGAGSVVWPNNKPTPMLLASGTFDLSGFPGSVATVQQKGGTFRSDNRWTDTSDVSSDIDKELDSAFSKTVAKLQEMGKTLGVETSKSIEDYA